MLLASAKIQPENCERNRVFGIKSQENILAFNANHLPPGFRLIARLMNFVDSGGLVAVDFTCHPFRNIRRRVCLMDEVEMTSA